MLDGILDAAFLQAACARIQTKISRIAVGFISASTSIPILIKCDGEITVEYTRDGHKHTNTYTNLDYTGLPGVSVDAHTYIVIEGKVTKIGIDGPGSSNVNEVNLSDGVTLEYIDIDGSNLQKLFMPNNDTAVTYCGCDIPKIVELRVKSNNSRVSSSMANAITYADNAGVLYTNDDGAYYDTLRQAALAKNWNIVTSNEQ